MNQSQPFASRESSERHGMHDPATTNASVHDLIDRARIADKAAVIAAENGDVVKSKELAAKARDLRADAEAVDPTHAAAAWADLLGV
jgi:sulfur carrier protein ThiS